MFERSHVSLLLSRLAGPCQFIQVVRGPRQAGKTTLVQQALARLEREGRPFTYVAVDAPSSPWHQTSPQGTSVVDVVLPLDANRRDVAWLQGEWQRARGAADGAPDTGWVLVLDEIQKVERWSDAVKGLWDADRAAGRNLHVVLLGSAPLLMQRGLRESLAGRFEEIAVAHWSFTEMHEAFDLDLEGYVYFGGYPGAAPLIDEEPRWRSYVHAGLVESTIERDVFLLARVDKPALLRSLFALGCRYSGQIMSYNKMLGQLQDAGNTTTLANHLHLLASVGLLTGLQNHSRKAHRVRASSPKWQVLNTALMSALSGYTLAAARADRSFWGRLVESAVGAHLCNTLPRDVDIRYWRESPYEVDFVLERAGEVVGIEVTTGDVAAHKRPLDQFRERFAPRRVYLVGGPDLSLAEFLSQPAEHWLE